MTLYFIIFLLFSVYITELTSTEIQRNPVIIVHGDAGSQMQLKLNKTSSPHFWCSKKSDWFTNWLSLEELLPEVLDCFTDNMRLVFNTSDGSYSNSPGVQARMPYFGGTTGIEYLDPSTKEVGEYFASFVQGLVDTGYVRGMSIRAAPYDFRKSPDLTGDYFNKLKNLIEETFAINRNMPVVLVCHSLGCPYSSIFLQQQEQQWKNKYLRLWMTISAPWGGSVKTLKLYASGYTFGIPRIVINPLKLRLFQRSIKSSIYLLPSKKFWKPDHIFVRTERRNYTINDYDVFFKDIGYPIAIDMYKLVPPVFTEEPPNVPVLCLYGSNINTPVSYVYKSGSFPDGSPVEVMSNGDGTVPLNSLNGCKRWQQDQPVVVKDFPSNEHNGILRNKTFIDFVKDVLYNSTF